MVSFFVPKLKFKKSLFADTQGQSLGIQKICRHAYDIAGESTHLQTRDDGNVRRPVEDAGNQLNLEVPAKAHAFPCKIKLL